MKKLLFTICILLACISIQAQQSSPGGNNKLKQDSVMHNNLDGSYYRKEIFRYNADGNTIFYASYIWRKIEKYWYGNTMTKSEYDANGNLTKQTQYAGAASIKNEWLEATLVEFVYDTNGRLTAKNIYIRSTIDDKWVNWQKYEYTYDTNGILTGDIFYTWLKEEVWKESAKRQYQYDTAGNITAMSKALWNNALSIWSDYSTNKYTYDTSGNLIRDDNYYWNGDDWHHSGKREYEYNAAGKQITSTSYHGFNGGPSTKTEYQYDAEGNPTKDTLYHWDEDNSEWKLRRYTIHYNQEPPAPVPTSISNTQQTLPLALYPNPAQSTVYLQGITQPAQVTIYTTNGQLLLQQQVQPGAGIHVGNLSKGLYLLKVNDTILKLLKE